MRSPIKKVISILVIVAVLLFPVQPAFSYESGSTATVTVAESIDVTLTGTTILFGTVDPGNSQIATSGPLNVTVESNTNVNTNLSINGTEFDNAGTKLGEGNFTFRNSTTGSWTTLAGTYGDGSYSDWQTITAPAGGPAATKRTAYLNVTIPSGQVAGTYTGQIYVLIQKDG